MQEPKPILVSKKQLQAIKDFFVHWYEDILYWGWARWGKSEAIWLILAICIAAFPWASWLVARTQLSHLKATTLSSFKKVLARLWFQMKTIKGGRWKKNIEACFRDKIKDENRLEFVNWSFVYVLQVNYEPWDPEFDRVWSYWYTWVFLDEWQQMDNKVREVCSWRLSELDWSFRTVVLNESNNQPNIDNFMSPWEGSTYWYSAKFAIVWEICKVWEETKLKPKPEYRDTIKEWEYYEVINDWPNKCYIVDYYTLQIPYTLMNTELVKNKNGSTVIHEYAWQFKGCILTWCNPGTNFTRTEFYRPWKDWTIEEYKTFIPSLVGDNPWVPEWYVKKLERLPEESVRKQRLLYGNFDFTNEPNMLFNAQMLDTIFNVEYSWDKTRYLTIDVARQGKDSTEIWYWEGLHLKEITKITKLDFINAWVKVWNLKYQRKRIEEICEKKKVDIETHVIVDEVWVGWGLVDELGCIWFVWNASPVHPYESKYLYHKKRNYFNLRVQSYFYLQSKIDKIVITCNMENKQQIIEELLEIKQKDIENDRKIMLVDKKEIKRMIGRSPDKADMMSMRMWFIIDNHHYWIQDESDDSQMEEKEKKEETIEEFMDWLIAEANKEGEKYEERELEPDFAVFD